MKSIIYEKLSEGKENATPLKDLKNLFPHLSQRNLLKQIERERAAGYPILNLRIKGGGYFKPKDPEEIRECLAILGQTIYTYKAVYDGIAKNLEK